MSHFATIAVEVKDIAALRAACQELGLDVTENAEARGYGSNKIHGDHVIRLKGPYDVALQRQTDGNYTLTADLWQGHVEKELGSGFGRLKQIYGVHKATIEARRRGMSVRRQNRADGTIRVALCRV
jgi:hypothetical protein